MSATRVRAFADAGEDAVVALWHDAGLVRPRNDPHRDVERKKRVQRELFLVACLLMAEVEARLTALGCPKLNVQVRSGNEAATAFYDRLGDSPDGATGLGKRLIPD